MLRLRVKRFIIRSDSCFYHDNVARPVLDGTEQAQDDHDDVKEVDHDGSPLVSEKIKHLPLYSGDLEGQHEEKQSLKTPEDELLKTLGLLGETVLPWLQDWDLLSVLHTGSYFIIIGCQGNCAMRDKAWWVKRLTGLGVRVAHEGGGEGGTERRTKWVQPFIVLVVVFGGHCFS